MLYSKRNTIAMNVDREIGKERPWRMIEKQTGGREMGMSERGVMARVKAE